MTLAANEAARKQGSNFEAFWNHLLHPPFHPISPMTGPLASAPRAIIGTRHSAAAMVPER